MAVLVRLALWKFHKVKLTWADVWADLLIIVGSYAVVVLGTFVVNLFRAPVWLDNDRAKEIADLTAKLKLVEPLRGQKEIKLKFAALMRRQVEIRGRLECAPNGAEFTKSLAEVKEWISQTVSLLNEAELPTDAEAFSQVGNLAPVAEDVDEFRHVEDWKRGDLARLRMYRKKLDAIMSNRRL